MKHEATGEGGRRALLIGAGEYEDDRLSTLLSPAADCAALAEVLKDPEIGGFEVQDLVDTDRSLVDRAIGDFFRQAGRNDLLLLYFSCHGLESNDKLYFALRHTDRDQPIFTGIPATLVREAMDACRARSIVVILDCCHSGLFPPGAKGEGAASFEKALAGHGRVVLTAGTGNQLAWEGDHPDGGAPALSRFTGALVAGLRSGAADLNGDGLITVSELHTYACEQVHREGPGQTPSLGGRLQYDIALAKVRKKPRKRATSGTRANRRSPAVRPQPVSPWRVAAASGPAGQPVLHDGLLIVQEKSLLYVIDAKSHRRYPLIRMRHTGPPAFHGGAVYFPGRGGALQAVDLRTGRPRHVRPVKVRDGFLTASADTLYAAAPDTTLRALDPETGADRRPPSPTGARMTCAPVRVADAVLYVTSAPGPADAAEDRVVAVGAATGRHMWTRSFGSPLVPEWFTATDQGLYVVERAGPEHHMVTSLDPADGGELWTYASAAPLAAAPAAGEGRVVLGDTDGRLTVLDGRCGDVAWERKTEGRLLTPAFFSGDTLLTADRAARLTARRLSTGRRLACKELLLSPDPRSGPAVGDGVLYLTDSRGDVHAMRADLR
ncbi:caspase, EACC1-associated type [Streptomyces sp. URMC 126]|uniref:caspase, EACC1-associated type n=1 Tax=Streptomyces sp. URMC 126 TaxID=3423401 RepID=UPI003F1CB14C